MYWLDRVQLDDLFQQLSLTPGVQLLLRSVRHCAEWLLLSTQVAQDYELPLSTSFDLNQCVPVLN
jgi:hypothetical protein